MPEENEIQIPHLTLTTSLDELNDDGTEKSQPTEMIVLEKRDPVIKAEELDRLSIFRGDMTTYLGEMCDKFITGMADIDAEWDKYVADLNKIGLKEYMEIMEAQYSRYKTK